MDDMTAYGINPYITKSARQFLQNVRAIWEYPRYEDTALLGLSEFDRRALRAMCESHGESYATAKREVMGAIRNHCEER